MVAQREYKTRHDWLKKVIYWKSLQEIESWPHLMLINKRQKSELVDFLNSGRKWNKAKWCTNTWNLLQIWKVLWNIWVKIILIGVSALGTLSRNLEKELKELEISRKIRTISTTELLRSAKTLRRSWGPVEICCHSDSRERPAANVGVRTCQERNYAFAENEKNKK